MTSNLRAFQEDLKKLIFPGETEREDSLLWGRTLPDRLRVYRNNTRSNWTDALDAVFRLSREQFTPEAWQTLRRHYFIKHPAAHWELNASLAPFLQFLSAQKVSPWTKELADYEWQDLSIFIDRASVKKGLGVSNPTATARVYQHQIFFWVEEGAPRGKPPRQKPEVLLFYRDAKNTSHITEADPLMLLLLEHFRKPGARLEGLEPVRRSLLPQNHVPLEEALQNLKDREIILI